jgi:hypothetical protein
MALNVFCIVSCGESVGIMFNSLFDHTGFAINITSILISIAVLMAGIYDPKLYLVALGACVIGYRMVSFLLLWAVKG